MVNMDMGEHQRLDFCHRESDLQLPGCATIRGSFRALEEAAIHQYGSAIGQQKLMARTGDAVDGAVVAEGVGDGHGGPFNPRKHSIPLRNLSRFWAHEYRAVRRSPCAVVGSGKW